MFFALPSVRARTCDKPQNGGLFSKPRKPLSYLDAIPSIKRPIPDLLANQRWPLYVYSSDGVEDKFIPKKTLLNFYKIWNMRAIYR